LTQKTTEVSTPEPIPPALYSTCRIWLKHLRTQPGWEGILAKLAEELLSALEDALDDALDHEEHVSLEEAMDTIITTIEGLKYST
jgi:hypothetical protein